MSVKTALLGLNAVVWLAFLAVTLGVLTRYFELPKGVDNMAFASFIPLVHLTFGMYQQLALKKPFSDVNVGMPYTIAAVFGPLVILAWIFAK